jgi:hypothetical protein
MSLTPLALSHKLHVAGLVLGGQDGAGEAGVQSMRAGI